MDPENEDLDQIQYDFPSNMSILCIYPEFKLFLFIFSDFKISSMFSFIIPPKKNAPKSIDHQNIGRHPWGYTGAVPGQASGGETCQPHLNIGT